MAIVLIVIWLILLQVLVKLGVLKGWALWMKLSPLVIYLAVMAVIFIPMNFGAPVGKSIVMQNSIPIAPAVSGLVTEVGDIVGREHVNKGDLLFRIGKVPYQSRVDQLNAQLELANIRREQARELVKKKAGRVGDVQKYDAEVKALQAQLDKASIELEYTDVRAPVDGYVPTVALRPGTWVNTGVPVMRFIETSESMLVVHIDQVNLRHVKPGQEAEVIFKLYPGKVFNATVASIIEGNPDGLLTPSANVVSVSEINSMPSLVALKMTDEMDLPAGMVGQATVFTEEFGNSHVIRKIMLRMDTWVNFIKP
jgi:RND family efflux transporter MFP subunit